MTDRPGHPDVTNRPSRARGCFARISQAGSWLSLAGAAGCWLVVALFFALGAAALQSDLDWLTPSFSAAEEADGVLLAVVLVVLEFIAFGLAILAALVALMIGILAPAALACALHLIGVAASFAALVSSKTGGAGRLMALPALALHVLGGVGAVVWLAYWAQSLATQQG